MSTSERWGRPAFARAPAGKPFVLMPPVFCLSPAWCMFGRRPAMRFLWTLSWIALFSQGAVAQQPRLASIDGIVVERDSGVPIARANVELRRTQARGANASSDLSRLQEQIDAVSSAVVVTGGTSGGTAAVAPTSRVA